MKMSSENQTICKRYAGAATSRPVQLSDGTDPARRLDRVVSREGDLTW